MRRLLILLTAMSLLSGCASASKDFREADGNTSVISGERFGVTIGMTREQAQARLLADPDVRLMSRTDCSRRCEGAEAVDRYRLEKLLWTGYIEIFSNAGKVVRIKGWRRPHELS